MFHTLEENSPVSLNPLESLGENYHMSEFLSIADSDSYSSFDLF